jgi:hypothetical protein
MTSLSNETCRNAARRDWSLQGAARGLACLALTVWAALPFVAPAHAVPIVQTNAIAVTDTGAPSVFGFLFSTPFAYSGPTQVTVSVVGAFGDGARDGASVTPDGAAPLVQVSFNASPVAGAGAGGAASFAGDGGRPGTVLIGPVGVEDVGAPSQFGFFFNLPIGAVTDPTMSQGAVAGGIVDGGFDGATIAGLNTGGGIGQFRVVGTTAEYEVLLGAFDDTAPFAGATSEQIPCSATDDCTHLNTDVFFSLQGGGDAAALVSRHEFGGDPIQGTVLATYGIATGSGTFDCATISGGCVSLNTALVFGLSGGGDTAAFAVRVTAEPFAVPEPPTWAALGLVLTALGFMRRRAISFVATSREQ